MTVTPDALASRLCDFGLGGRARRSHFAREDADEPGDNGGETAGYSKGLEAEAHRTYLSVSVISETQPFVATDVPLELTTAFSFCLHGLS
jgi:hypothetical protein